MCHVPFSLDHTSQHNVELLYNAEAHIAEGPFYDQDNRQLLWVNIVHVSLLLSKCIMVSTSFILRCTIIHFISYCQCFPQQTESMGVV